MSAAALAAAAAALEGTRFRMHGRDPATGIDCIGLLSASLKAIGHRANFPSGYTLRTSNLEQLLPDPEAAGFVRVEGPLVIGDVVMLRLGPAQFHLAIVIEGARFVHAHAGLRRVVVGALPLPGEPLHRWRLHPENLR